MDIDDLPVPDGVDLLKNGLQRKNLSASNSIPGSIIVVGVAATVTLGLIAAAMIVTAAIIAPAATIVVVAGTATRSTGRSAAA